MKKLALALILVSFAAHAEITETGRDGKAHSYNQDEYVVVKRRPKGYKPKPRPTPSACPLVVAPAPTPQAQPEATKVYKNTFKAYLGYGPGGFSTTQVPSSITVNENFGALFGLGYSRQLSPRWSVEAVGISNHTGLLGAGYSFWSWKRLCKPLRARHSWQLRYSTYVNTDLIWPLPAV